MGTHDGREGRPSLFTPDIKAAILLTLEAGHFRQSAATLNGLAAATLQSWLRRGRLERKGGLDTEFTQFLTAVEQAEARSESRLLDTATVLAYSLKDPAMVRWLLERRHPHWNDKLMRQIRDLSARMKDAEKAIADRVP